MSKLFEKIVGDYTARLQSDLIIKGFQADGIFGNVGLECNGFATMQEMSPIAGTGGYGWQQWTGPRRKSYFAFCRAKNIEPSEPESNYLFLVHESLGDERASLALLRLTKTRDEAVEVWCDKNERPGVRALNKRIEWAKLAEAARLKVENQNLANAVTAAKPVEPEQKGTVMNDTVVTGTVVASTSMVAALQQVEDKALTFVAKQLAAHGGFVGAGLAAMLPSLVKNFDLPHKAEAWLKEVDIEQLVVLGVNKLLTKTA